MAIARALVHDPPLLLADEPTAHLDYVQVEGVLRLLRSLARPGRVVIISTHDERLIPIADKVVELVPTAERTLSNGHKKMKFRSGEVLFRQGSMGNHIYVLRSGRVDVVRELLNGREELLGQYGAGEYFGELGPLLGFPRAATARATEDTECTAYTVAEFKTFLGAERLADVVADGRRPRRRRR